MKHNLYSFWLMLLVMLGASSSVFGQYPGTGTFEKISALSELTDGYYVIADQDSKFVMKNANAGSYFAHEAISLTGNAVVNPSASIVWKIQFDGPQFTIFNEQTAKFVSYTGTSNTANAVDDAASNNQKWTATVASSIFTVNNAAVTARMLQYNSTSPRFACYTTNQKKLLLYKLATGVSVPSLNPISAVVFGEQNVNTSASQNINIKGTNLTGDLAISVTGDGFSGSTTVTKAEAESGKDIAITFAPTAVGSATGEITISGGGLENQVVVSLTGTAISNQPALTPIDAVDFGLVTVNESVSKMIVIEGRNLTGDLTVTVAGDAFSGSTTVLADDVMAVGGKAVAVAFNPSVVGVVAGTVTISGGGLTSSVVVNLSGEGKAQSTAIPVFTENFNGFTKGQPNSGANSSDISAALNDYTTLPGWTGSKVYEAGGAVKMGGSSALGWIQTPAIDLSANGGAFVVSFKAMAWSGDATSFFIYVNGVKTEVTGLSASSNYTFSDFELSLSGGTSETVIKFEGKQASRGRFFIEDLVIAQEKGNTPLISSFDLNLGTVNINQPSVGVMTVVGANLTSDIAVSVTGEGFSTTTPSIAKEGGEVSITFSAATKGEYTGAVTLTSGETSATFNLSANVIDPAEYRVANIAALKAKGTADKTSVFTLTGDVTFVYRNDRYIFVQDNTDGLLIYDEFTPVITTQYNEGDIISGGIQGKITEYGGMFEFIPTSNTAQSTENIGTVSAESVSLTTLKNNYAQYSSRLVSISGVTFQAGSFNTTTVTNLNITQDGETIVCRNAFKTLDKEVPSVANVKGFAAIYNGSIQIYPRSNDDIYIITDTDSPERVTCKVINQADGILIDQVNAGETIRIYNASGSEVTKQIAVGTRQKIALGKGLYIVHVGNSTVKVVR